MKNSRFLALFVFVFMVVGGLGFPLARSCGASMVSVLDENAYHEYHSRYNQAELTDIVKENAHFTPLIQSVIQNGGNTVQNIQSSWKGPLDSPWPMMSHDVYHTGRSPYNTTRPPEGVEIWRFLTQNYFDSGVVIDNEGILYFGCMDGYVYSIYPNGTLRWKTNLYRSMESTPAIDENGIIYIGTALDGNCLFALYSNNGTLKWSYPTGNFIDSSPAIGADGTIYFGDWNGWVHALHPDGTIKWKYHTGDIITGSPAIGSDGTVYIGSHDSILYAFNPDNGTVKWKFDTGGWVRVSPCVGNDGTVYCVSFDGYLYAISPNNGAMKWRTFVNAGTNPTIGPDGTIYAGWDVLYAVNPDGSVKWTFSGYGAIEGGTPCTSKEGIIYFGNTDGKIVAVNPNGTLRWKRSLKNQCQSPPAIDSNGFIYIGSEYDVSNGTLAGFLHAFGQGLLRAEANGPYKEVANNSIQFMGDGFGGLPPYTFHWEFGDNHSADEQNPKHYYMCAGTYNAVFTVTDSKGNHSSDNATVIITYPPPLITLVRPTYGIYFLDKKILRMHYNVIAIGPITMEANVTQNPLPIAYVEFLINGNVGGVIYSPPYKWTWKTLYFGHENVCAIAYDTVGNIRFSEVITIWKFF